MPMRYATIDPACVQRSVPDKRNVHINTNVEPFASYFQPLYFAKPRQMYINLRTELLSDVLLPVEMMSAMYDQKRRGRDNSELPSR